MTRTADEITLEELAKLADNIRYARRLAQLTARERRFTRGEYEVTIWIWFSAGKWAWEAVRLPAVSRPLVTVGQGSARTRGRARRHALRAIARHRRAQP